MAHLALKSGAPIVPLAIFGTEQIPGACLRLRRTTVHVRIGRPTTVATADTSAQALRAETDRVMLELARMLPAEYRGFYADAVAEDESAERRKSA